MYDETPKSMQKIANFKKCRFKDAYQHNEHVKSNIQNEISEVMANLISKQST